MTASIYGADGVTQIIAGPGVSIDPAAGVGIVTISATGGGGGGGSSGVTAFNGRTGIVTLSTSDVTSALGYTPVTPIELSTKQSVLVSGTNIKTINGNSILGSGDLVVSGGGGGTTGTSILSGNGSGGFANVSIGAGLSFSAGTLSALGGGAGTVTSVSVTTANGFAGTVATGTTTPNITLYTTITGLLKGNGTSLSAAVSGTDYSPATVGSAILAGNGSGGFTPVAVGSGLSYSAGTLSISGGAGLGTVTTVSVVSANGLSGTVANPTTTPAITLSTSVNGLVKGNGASFSAASAGTDYLAPGAALAMGAAPSQRGTYDSTGGLVSTSNSKFVFVEGTAGSPVTSTDYAKPLFYLERHTATFVPNMAALWGNSKKTATALIHTDTYAGETGEVNGLAILTRNKTAISGATILGFSAQADSQLTSGTHPAVFGANIIASFGGSPATGSTGGTAPNLCVGIEVDVINYYSNSDTLRPTGGSSTNYTAFWAQSAGGTGVYANTGLLITNAYGANGGWNYGVCADSYFRNHVAYLRNMQNSSTAHGLYVETTWGASTSKIVEFAIGANTKFLVDGAVGAGLNGVWLYVNGSLKEVQVGAADSAGTGYRTLRVTN